MIDVRVVDESGSEMGVGQPGVVARGANVMRGFARNTRPFAKLRCSAYRMPSGASWSWRVSC
jgi:hypothetical protein